MTKITENNMYKFNNKYRIPSARLQNWDYGSAGAYFVTICTKNRECWFGDISNGVVELSEIGEIANKYWVEIPNHFPFVILGAHIIMPNHTHGILILNNVETLHEHVPVETLHATSLQRQNMSSISPKKGSLSTIIRGFKSAVTKHARQININFAWQSRFYDHVIRNEKSLYSISEYINNNPLNWKNDDYNPLNLEETNDQNN
jgi:REP element-mobilizing transposase RayT